MKKTVNDIVDKLIETMPKDVFTVKQVELFREFAPIILQHIEDQYSGLSEKAYTNKQSCVIYVLQSMLNAIVHVERDHVDFLEVILNTADVLDRSAILERVWLNSGMHLN